MSHANSIHLNSCFFMKIEFSNSMILTKDKIISKLNYVRQGFPYWGEMGGVPRPVEKLLIPPSTEKIPLPNKFPPPLYQRFSASTKKQFSCYNPIKASFLAVVIAPIPFLF